MTANQEPPGPRKGRRLAPDELARDFAKRLKSSGSSEGGGRRFLPHFDLLNAGRLVMGLGALLLGAALVAGLTWLSGLSRYETSGTVAESSPVYACPGDSQLGEVFEGETITLIGRSPDQLWLVVRDERGPGNAVYVLETVVEVEGDVSLLSTRECHPSDGQPIAAGQTTPPEESTTAVSTIPTTTVLGETTTTGAPPIATGRPPRRRNSPSPGTTTTTTTKPGVTTTTKPGVTTTTKAGATTTTRGGSTSSTSSSTTSSSSTSTSSSTTTSSSTSTSTSTTTTTVPDTSTTTEPSTTTTEASTSTTLP